jgi:heptosyltransferase II
MGQRPPLRPAERILVVHTAFLGDIVLATPFLAALRALYPAAKIHFLTTPGGALLLQPNLWAVEPIAFHKRGKDGGPAGFWRMARNLRALQPDLVLNLHRSMRSALLAKASGGEVWGFSEAAGSFLFRGTVGRRPGAFEAEKNLHLLQAAVGAGDFPLYPSLQISAADEQRASALLGATEKFVALAPSSVWATKRWPAEKYAELAGRIQRELGLTPVIVGSDSAEDKEAAAAVMAVFQRRGEKNLPLNLTGSTSLGALKSVLARAKIVISNDSSPLHMAIAVGTKTVGIYGPTTRDLGFFPLAPPGFASAVEVNGLECRPCGMHGHKSCPRGHFRCMLELEVEQVFREVKSLVCP